VHTTDCSIRVLWRHLGEALQGVLGTITIADLVTGAPSVRAARRAAVHVD
jgi:DNA-binding IscR family transcriptional regulator